MSCLKKLKLFLLSQKRIYLCFVDLFESNVKIFLKISDHNKHSQMYLPAFLQVYTYKPYIFSGLLSVRLVMISQDACVNKLLSH